jgi:hypothetical protein
MNWCSVVFVGFMAISAAYYMLFARKGTWFRIGFASSLLTVFYSLYGSA